MLTAEALKPLLLHSDGYVRDTVVRCLRDAWARDVELVPTILAACRRFGFAANNTALHAWDRFPLDSPVFEDVVATRAALGPGKLGQRVGALLVKGPVDLLRDHGDRLCLEGLLSPKQAKTMSHRIEAAGLSAAEVLEGLRRPESEDAMIALLESEPDLTIRTTLCQALCRLFSPRGVELARKQVADGYDTMMVELEDEILVAADVLGLTIPEDADWRRQRDHDEQRRERRRNAMARLLGERTAKEDEASLLFNPREWDDALAPVISSGKVGRNEPCSCGSGKKYKRCCGGI